MKLWIDYEIAPPSNEWAWAQSLGCAMVDIISKAKELEVVSIYDNPSDILGLLYYFSTYNIECPLLVHEEGDCE